MNEARVYLTTTLPYVNAKPHIGFALEIVQADIVARFKELQGKKIFFNTGTDEHGLKILNKAVEEGKDPQAYTDEYAEKFKGLKDTLNLHPSLHFIRTTDLHHTQAAQEMWRRCQASGDIYKKKFKGMYCSGDEIFVKEGDMVDGKCPNHPHLELIEIEEENYFFRLSNYEDKLLDYLRQDQVIVPDWRRDEAITFVENGLEDFSISRDKSRFNWGIPVPDDDSQVMYVWFDALTNYITTLGWPDDKEQNFQHFWVEGKTLQFAGKDQVRFQSIMWQAMLMSAGLPTTNQVIYHGFITSGGQKMSKSLGNVIDPVTIAHEYSTDALRYFLARHISPFEDANFTMERFVKAYNADLANGLGNLVSRTLTMIEQFYPDFDLGAGTPDVSAQSDSSGVGSGDLGSTEASTDPPLTTVSTHIETLAFDKALTDIWGAIRAADEYIEQTKPWELAKNSPPDKGELEGVLSRLYLTLLAINQQIAPFLPATHDKLTKLLTARPLKKPTKPLFARKN